MLIEERLLGLAARLADRLDEVSELREVAYSVMEEMQDWVGVNEAALGLEFLADRLFDHAVPLTSREFEEIEACRVACGLPADRRFSALRKLIPL